MKIKYKPSLDTFENSTITSRDNFITVHFGEAYIVLSFLPSFTLSAYDYVALVRYFLFLGMNCITEMSRTNLFKTSQSQTVSVNKSLSLTF